MRLRSLATATALALTVSVAPTMAAEAASKPAYKISISTSKTKADVGQTIKVSGTVKGSKSAKKRITVQVKTGGKWKTVKKVRTTKKSRYATTIKVATAGKQQVRVVAPKSKKARQGVSKARGFVGWRWLDLTKQPIARDGSVKVGAVKIAGKKYAKAITIKSGGRATFTINDRCDVFKGGFGVKDGINKDASVTTFHSTQGWGDSRDHAVAANARAKNLRYKIKDGYWFGIDVGAGVVTAVNPSVHCTVNRLPKK